MMLNARSAQASEASRARSSSSNARPKSAIPYGPIAFVAVNTKRKAGALAISNGNIYNLELVRPCSTWTEFRFEFSVKNYVFQHWTKFWHFLRLCKFDFFEKCRILKFITSKTHWNKGFQPLGVSKNDFSWSKAAWSIFQSLFWLEKWYFCILHPKETYKEYMHRIHTYTGSWVMISQSK